MKLAETVRSRWVLALVSVAFGATAIVAVSKTCNKPPKKEAVVTKTVKPWRGCKQRKAVTPPRREATGSDYRDVLLGAKPAFDACTQNEPAGVTYEIRMPIDPTGQVTSVEVRGTSPDIANVSMKVVKCLETAVSGLRFPATGERTFVSTNLRTE